jgi:hypothetical protein
VTENDVIVTKPSTVTREAEKKLIFTKDMPMKKRIEAYQGMYPDSSFVPNWVANGFLSQEEALQYAMKCVRDNPATKNLGLGND